MSSNGFPKLQVNTIEDYEYVIVGSGAGGGPLAANLARNGHKVLLLEAGDDQGANLNYQVPAFHFKSTEDESMSWDFFVKHYGDDALARKDSKMTWITSDGKQYVGLDPPKGSQQRGIFYPRAGTLGGCTAHNAMITLYPHDSDWANIAKITGDDSWAPGEMRKYFQHLERNEDLPREDTGHGYSGWLGTSRADLKLALGDLKVVSIVSAAAAFMAKSLLTAIPHQIHELFALLLQDINSSARTRDRTEGLYQLPLAMSRGRRNGTRELLVQTAKHYPLDIKLNCLATKVLFEKMTGTRKPKAIGVEFLEGKSLYKADPRSAHGSSVPVKHRVLVTREVILAGGAFNTPQLLKLSGIGPKEELEQFGIPVIKEMPAVGTNLQDRYEIPIVSKIHGDFPITAKCTFGEPGDPCLEDWTQHKGPYQSNGLPVGIVKRSKYADVDPDLFIFGGPALFKGYHPGYSPLTTTDRKHFTWAVLKAHAHNPTGTVKLTSANPRDTPAIDFNYFPSSDAETTERDLDAVVEGVQIARRIMDDVLPIVTGPIEEESPGRHISSVAEIKDFIKSEAWGHHASCSCPIGADGDPKAVLDSRFRVQGIDSLRVVDASVFPKIPGFFIVVPVYMISEKATDAILQGIGETRNL